MKTGKKVFEAFHRILPAYAEYFEGFESPYTFHSDKTYEALLKSVGFSTYQAHLVSKDMMHDTLKAFRGWLETTWFPFINRVPSAQQTAFIEAWIEAYVALCPLDQDGRVHIGMMRLEVQLSK